MSAFSFPMRDGVTASCVALPNVAQNLTILAFLQQRFAYMDANVWLERMRAGLLMDEAGVAVCETDMVAERLGMHLYYYREVPSETPIPFHANIIFEDEHLLVADKPHFLPVMPAGAYVQQTLLVRLRRAFELPELTPLHRIDRETAGLVMFAKHAAVRDAYQALFRERHVSKYYEAIAPWLATVKLPQQYSVRMQESADFFRMEVVKGVANSTTHIDIIEHNQHWARYLLQPISGKRHQLRVHMTALGLPLLHDSLYPHKQQIVVGDYTHPLQLLARVLCFRDPLSGKERQFESQLSLLELPVDGI